MTSKEIQYPRVVYKGAAGLVVLNVRGGGLDWVLSPDDLSRLQREIAQARAQQISAEARRERTGVGSRLRQGVMRLVGGST